MCSNRIAISAVKSEYVPTERENKEKTEGTHHEKEHDLGSKSIDSNRAGTCHCDEGIQLKQKIPEEPPARVCSSLYDIV